MPKKVTVYSTEVCRDCKLTKFHMGRLGVEFDAVDLDTHPDAAEIANQLVFVEGFRAQPVVKVVHEDGREESWAGYSLDRITALAAA